MQEQHANEPLRTALREALSLAATAGAVSVVRQLLAAGADPNERNEHGSVPLALALTANNCRIETVRALLEGGASPHVTSIGAAEPLVAALYAGNPSLEIVKLLVAAGANVNANGGKLLARSVDVHGLVIVQLLVEAGADVNQAYPLDGPMELLPFEIAAMRGRVDVAQYLVSAGAVIPDSVRAEDFWVEWGGADNPVRRLVNADTIQRTMEQVMAHDAAAGGARPPAGPSPL